MWIFSLLSHCVRPLKDLLKKEADIFTQKLSKRFKRSTVQQYDIVIGWWTDYIFNYSDALTFDDINVSDCRSKFFNQVRYDIDMDSKVVYGKLKKFLVFLKDEGYENEKVFKAYGV
jgi:hypothetical protein